MVRARRRSLATFGHSGPHKTNMSIVRMQMCYWFAMLAIPGCSAAVRTAERLAVVAAWRSFESEGENMSRQGIEP